MIGNKETLVQKPVISPMRRRDMITVNKGDELFTVSTNEIVACLRAIKPSTIEKSRKNPIIIILRQKSIDIYSDFLKLKLGDIISFLLISKIILNKNFYN